MIRMSTQVTAPSRLLAPHRVADTAAAAARASRRLDAAVTRARSRGYTWAQIAPRLGVTRQAAQQRCRPPATRNEG
jgi:hypothetical protein